MVNLDYDASRSEDMQNAAQDFRRAAIMLGSKRSFTQTFSPYTAITVDDLKIDKSRGIGDTTGIVENRRLYDVIRVPENVPDGMRYLTGLAARGPELEATAALLNHINRVNENDTSVPCIITRPEGRDIRLHNDDVWVCAEGTGDAQALGKLENVVCRLANGEIYDLLPTLEPELQQLCNDILNASKDDIGNDAVGDDDIGDDAL